MFYKYESFYFINELKNRYLCENNNADTNNFHIILIAINYLSKMKKKNHKIILISY